MKTTHGAATPMACPRLFAHAAFVPLLLCLLWLAGCNDEDSSYYADSGGETANAPQTQPDQPAANAPRPVGRTAVSRPRGVAAGGTAETRRRPEIDEAEQRRREEQAQRELEALVDAPPDASQMVGMWTSIDDEGYETALTVKANGAEVSAQAISPDVIITFSGAIDGLGTVTGTWTQRGVDGDPGLNLNGTFVMIRKMDGNLFIQTRYVLDGEQWMTPFTFVRRR